MTKIRYLIKEKVDKIWKIRNLDELNELSKWLISQFKSNIFLLLSGQIGVGKTTLTKLIAANIGIKETIISPTYTICQKYLIKEKECYLNHFDFFRLTDEENLDFFRELTIDSINIIEWPENNHSFWYDQNCIWVDFRLDFDGSRIIKIYKLSRRREITK